MPRIAIVGACATLVVASILSASATGAAEPQPGRFTMTPADGGFIRLDTQTGQVSRCARQDQDWTCRSLPDERQALEKEIERLAAENAQLKTSVKRLEELAGVGEQAPGRSAERHDPKLQLPSEEDVDRALTYVQRMLKKFKDKLKEFEDSERKGTQL